MSDSSENSSSGNPNVPQIPHGLYINERADFARDIIGVITYGRLKYHASAFAGSYLSIFSIIQGSPSFSFSGV